MKGVARGNAPAPHNTPPTSGPLPRAVLGPTNTGKTHYALTRMMAHDSGVIGFPLRLLARENYERLVRAKGERSVALVTGEEKIVPSGACWFSCTVEAMPLDRKTAFVAVDEIQLAADPERGHVFTDRLLRARGTAETLFLGAATIAPLLRALVPGIAIETRERLSTLVHTGETKLSRLPSRSAIVAFSMAEVYALAESVRARRGGCAVVMGQLSPRTRNAQVELYQNRDVDYLVATDAIGMGLNMDIDHVALARTRKFDGASPRALAAQEIAQIAGRAGRGMKDGTFGTTAGCAPLSAPLVEAVEQHRFDPVRHVFWRNHALDFAGPGALLASLTARPASRGLHIPGLRGARTASDVATLSLLAHDPETARLAKGREATRLLWEVCQIPDFRKLGDDSHARLCARLFGHLRREGAIPAAWMEGQLASLARTEGDIDTLMSRLTAVRVCAYVASRAEWSRDPALWRQRAREVEDRLSDALHERLTARFVDRRAAVLFRRLDSGEGGALLGGVTAGGEVIVEGHRIGRMRGFALEAEEIEGSTRDILLRAARKALVAEIPRRVRALRDAPDSAFSLDLATGVLAWDGAPVARLAAGDSALAPALRLLRAEFGDAAQAGEVRARLARYLDAALRRALAPLFRAREGVRGEPRLRGIVHRLFEDGGVTALTPGDEALTPQERAALRRQGVRIGVLAVYVPALLRPAPLALLTLLRNLRTGGTGGQPVPGRVCLPWKEVAGLPGWIRAGERGLRLDVAERCLDELRRLASERAVPAPPDLASRLGVKRAALPAILSALGIAHTPPAALADALAGPPAPLMLLRPSKPAHRREAARRRGRPDSPFAALAALHAS